MLTAFKDDLSYTSSNILIPTKPLSYFIFNLCNEMIWLGKSWIKEFKVYDYVFEFNQIWRDVTSTNL